MISDLIAKARLTADEAAKLHERPARVLHACADKTPLEVEFRIARKDAADLIDRWRAEGYRPSLRYLTAEGPQAYGRVVVRGFAWRLMALMKDARVIAMEAATPVIPSRIGFSASLG